MKNRKSVLRLPSGDTFELPLLVPSFTSKGFDFGCKSEFEPETLCSDTNYALEQLGKFITESLLVSAYDLHHSHFVKPEQHITQASLVFIDSGGYELRNDFDSSEPRRSPHAPKPFTPEDYRDQLTQLSELRLPIVAANFDWVPPEEEQKSLEKQIQDARSLFHHFPRIAANFIIKPEPNEFQLDINRIVGQIEQLKTFSVIGVTEKEIGRNLIAKLGFIARLREELDRLNATAPIHIWGGLDPLVTPLYFLAGADIFDGVSWLRYAYHNGFSTNSQGYPVIKGQLDMSRNHCDIRRYDANLMALRTLTNNLRAYSLVRPRSFAIFGDNRSMYEEAWHHMTTSISELRGVE
ncbi:hypothetical protein [Roseiconus lacunae]|uniref:hypothetical protein n=1 Tax=Roseiconus lacunae TaxID=2605694 RepID=UPI001E3AEB4E|nr:hypothetical protein [Roseiconus lacunae]